MVDKDLIAHLKSLRAHHEFIRDRIGQEGCPVRVQAAEYVNAIGQTIAALQSIREHEHE